MQTGRAVTKEQYEAAVKKLKRTGGNVQQVAGQTGLSVRTLRRIKASTSYRSYKAISRNAKLTKEQRSLLSQGYTLAEAREMTTAAQVKAGGHDLQNDGTPAEVVNVEPVGIAPAPEEPATAPVKEFGRYPSQSEIDAAAGYAGIIILLGLIGLAIAVIWGFWHLINWFVGVI